MLRCLVALSAVVVSLLTLAHGGRLDGRFHSLGVVHVHLPGLMASGCDASGQHCSLQWGDDRSVAGNVSLAFVRTSLDPPRARHASPIDADEARIDLQCYVGRHKYSMSNAYHHSESLHQLAADVHQEHRHTNHQVASVRPAQAHHRLRRLVQQRMDQQGADHMSSDEGQSEGEVLQDLVRDDAGTFSLQEDRRRAVFRDMIVSSAVPDPPFLNPSDASLLAQTAQDGGRRGLHTDLTSPMSFHGVPGVPSAPHSELHNRYSAPGDLVVARYIRTNNWKYCRNVQHGLYFNMTSTSGEEFYQNRCLVSQWLTDVCYFIDRDSTSPTTWKVLGGCASNGGAPFQYSAVRDARSDAHERSSPNAGDQWLPLTVRICYPSKFDVERPKNDKGMLLGDMITTEDGGVSLPSFEFMRRLVVEEFERARPVRALAQADSLMSLDWRDASFSGVRVPDPPSWTVVWWSLGGFALLMALVMGAVRWM